jgi:hypothetical protein
MDFPTVTAQTLQARQPARAWPALHALLAEVKKDAPLLAVAAAYAVVAWLVCDLAGRPRFYHPLIYMPIWLGALATFIGLYVVAFEMPRAIAAEPARPLTALLGRLRAHMTPRLAVGLLMFAVAGVYMGVFTCLKSLLNVVTPFRADAELARWDAMLHMGVDPWRLLQPLLGHHAITRVIQSLYLSGWALLVVGFTAAAALSKRLAHVRTRFFLTYFAAWAILGNVVAGLFMSAGPAYFAELTGDRSRYGALLDYLAFSDGAENSSVTLQHTLWTLLQQHQVELGTGISAFPSLHVAMMTLVTLTAFQVHRVVGLAVGAFALLIFAGSISLGWHYAVDGYASAGFIYAVWFGIGRLAPRPAP